MPAWPAGASQGAPTRVLPDVSEVLDEAFGGPA